MAENYSKSRLKRRKFCVEEKEIRRETTPPGEAGRDGSAESGSSGTHNRLPLPAPTRWSSHQPPLIAKSLWSLESLQGGLVPDLPPPSAAKPSSDLDGWRWCDLCAEVDPFPQSLSHSLIPSSLSFIQQDLPNKPAAASSSSFAEQSTTSQTETSLPLLSSKWTDPPRRTDGRRSDRCLQGSFSERPGSAGEEEKEQKHGGRGELQSCPMCLQEFPSGFSQMDCDSHLAQCLSDMNVDVTW